MSGSDEKTRNLQEKSLVIPHKIDSQYTDGPDQVLPAQEFTTSKINGRVRLRVSTKTAGSEQPVSVPNFLRSAAIRHPDSLALICKGEDNKWKELSYKQYLAKVRTIAKAFLKLGLERYHAVGILGFNSPQWFISDIAAIFAGGLACGIYTTNTAEACEYCLHAARANICVVQNQKQLDKILAVRHKLPLLRAIIQWEKPYTKMDGVYFWQDVLDLGNNQNDADLDAVLKTIAINEACTLVFTSGTVTRPKAVMLSHDNLTWDAFSVSERTHDLECPGERLISFLPLSHVAAQLCDIYLSMLNCFTVYFATPDALKGSLVDILKEVRPTRKEEHSTSYHIAKTLVLNKVRGHLGLDQCRTFVTAAAPLSTEIKKYFLSLDMPITDVFGMSETSGPHTLSIAPNFKLDSVGETIDGAETKFADSASPNGPGEIWMRGRHIFMGYLNEPQLTADAIDRDGWLHSGDIGKMDSKNMISVTGRIKEIIITAGGENVAPVLIEQTILAKLPHLGYAVVIGDTRKFLSVLLTIKCKMDTETLVALDDIDPDTVKWLSSLGCHEKTASRVSASKPQKVWKAIQEGIDRANVEAISSAQYIQKFAVLHKDFSIPSGELGPTMKVKRAVVHEIYKSYIEEMYNEQ